MRGWIVPTSRSRAHFERSIDLYEGGFRIGYASETLRHWLTQPPPLRPPFSKVRGRWRARLDAFDEWAIEQGFTLHELPAEGTLQPRSSSTARRRAS
jgi:hypothetical protein